MHAGSLGIFSKLDCACACVCACMKTKVVLCSLPSDLHSSAVLPLTGEAGNDHCQCEASFLSFTANDFPNWSREYRVHLHCPSCEVALIPPYCPVCLVLGCSSNSAPAKIWLCCGSQTVISGRCVLLALVSVVPKNVFCCCCTVKVVQCSCVWCVCVGGGLLWWKEEFELPSL